MDQTSSYQSLKHSTSDYYNSNIGILHREGEMSHETV